MSKIIRNVFLIIGTLVAMMIAWQLMFAKGTGTDSGILNTTYNALANNINKNWARVNNQDATLLPEWDNTIVVYDPAKNPTNYDMFRVTTGFY